MTKMYILLNERLTKSQKIPQASHAMAEFMHKFGQCETVKKWVEDDRTLICLETSEEKMMTFLADHSEETASFTDADLDSMLTAVAFMPVEKEVGTKLFSGLKLA